LTISKLFGIIAVQREQGIGTPEQEKLMFKNMRLK
jgi:hypothetical protein